MADLFKSDNVGVAEAAPRTAESIQLPAVIQRGEIIDAEVESTDILGFSQDTMGVERGMAVATKLDHIVKTQKLFTHIGTKDHLWVEAWCCLASMVGLAPRTAWCKRIQDEGAGPVLGYEARVEVIRIATNEVVGAAESECWMDEQQRGRLRWSEKHACKSMAQTRATSRAVAQILRWIPVLAGYAGTPAEDDQGEPHPQNERPAQKPNAAQAQPRGHRADKVELEAIFGAFKACRPPDERTAECFALFAAYHTGIAYTADTVTKLGNWTKEDISKCRKALEDNQ